MGLTFVCVQVYSYGISNTNERDIMNSNELGYLKGIAADRFGTTVEILEASDQFLVENEEAIRALFPDTTYYN